MAVLAFGFVGCAADDDENAFSGQTVDFDNAYVIVDNNGNVSHAENANDSDKNGNNAIENKVYYYRAFKKFATKHYGGTCVITINPQADNPTSNLWEGVAGFVFDAKTNDDKSYNFLIAAVRYNVYTKKLSTYISKYSNASIKDNNYTEKSNFTQSDGATSADEVEILKGTNSTESRSYYDLSSFGTNERGQIVVAIKVEQDETSGDYKVSYFKSLEDSKKEDVDPIYSCDIASSKKVLEGYSQGEMYMYANIYPGRQFWADFALKDKVGNDVPLESAIIEE